MGSAAPKVAAGAAPGWGQQPHLSRCRLSIGAPEVKGGGCSPIAQHGGVRSPIAQHEGGVRGGPQPPGAVQEAARYLRLITNREPTVGACLLIGTGKGERRDYREGSVIGERWGGRSGGAVRVWGTAVPKGKSVRGGFGVQRCQRGGRRSGIGWVWGTAVPRGKRCG